MPYITVDDIRAHIGDITPPTDQVITASIELWQSFLERATRSWFEPRMVELQLDGTDSDALHFEVPIIEVEWLKINGETEPLPLDYYQVYNNATSIGDDRGNPRIKLIRVDDYNDIFTAPLTHGELRFRKGRRNQSVRGTFGHLENGETPLLIKYALTRLVLEKLASPLQGPGPIAPPPVVAAGPVIEEWTDGHKYKTSDRRAVAPGRANALSGMTQDSEVLAIIKMYRAPVGLATPAHASYK